MGNLQRNIRLDQTTAVVALFGNPPIRGLPRANDCQPFHRRWDRAMRNESTEVQRGHL